MNTHEVDEVEGLRRQLRRRRAIRLGVLFSVVGVMGLSLALAWPSSCGRLAHTICADWGVVDCSPIVFALEEHGTPEQCEQWLVGAPMVDEMAGDSPGPGHVAALRDILGDELFDEAMALGRAQHSPDAGLEPSEPQPR